MTLARKFHLLNFLFYFLKNLPIVLPTQPENFIAFVKGLYTESVSEAKGGAKFYFAKKVQIQIKQISVATLEKLYLFHNNC